MGGTGSGNMFAWVLVVAAVFSGVAFMVSVDSYMLLVSGVCFAGSLISWIVGKREDRYVISSRRPRYRHKDWM